MGGTVEGTAEAGVEAHTGIGAMKSVLTGAIVEGMMMMIWMITMRVEVGGAEPQVQAIIAEGEAGAQIVAGEKEEVLLGMGVKRGVLESSSGTGKKKILKDLMQIIMITKGRMVKMVIHNKVDMLTDIH